MTTSADQTVAKTILAQLGGNRFIAMTGAINFISTANSLSFKLPANDRKITHVRIELCWNDLYKVEFLCCGVRKKDGVPEHYRDVIDTREDIYFDSLQEVFTRVTGLATHL
jgi:hypothetical protein